MHYLTTYYKNLCEQLEKKVNFLEKILKESQEGSDLLHDNIVHELAHRIARSYPHMPASKDLSAYQTSVMDIKSRLNSHPNAPFTNVPAAMKAIENAVIRGNKHVESGVLALYPTTHPRYDRELTRHEDEVIDTIIDDTHDSVVNLKNRNEEDARNLNRHQGEIEDRFINFSED